MIGSALALESLRACLAATAPVDLLGMRLLEEQPHPLGACPVLSRQSLIDAVTEIVVYTERCKTAARQLAMLPPIPLTSVSILEFGV